ncbi:hypothetical protein SLEP1_g21273 [Rubroshorea leprosula]|uniref:DUF4220 domain-containing protein n=1 Tax=Rubroshorea leprosula TaxID=152421 RepID=A0AAV5J5E0_9ROSI|nr:hypothetical protein SLEP1_g21273 [Rubroshorea leprosula]
MHQNMSLFPGATTFFFTEIKTGALRKVFSGLIEELWVKLMEDSTNGNTQPASPVCTCLAWQSSKIPRQIMKGFSSWFLFGLAIIGDTKANILIMLLSLFGRHSRRLGSHCCLKCPPQGRNEGAKQRAGCVLNAVPALAPWRPTHHQMYIPLFSELKLRIYKDLRDNFMLSDSTSADDAFKIVQIELGFLHDKLYTKTTALQSKKGIILQRIRLLSTFAAVIAFSFTVVLMHFLGKSESKPEELHLLASSREVQAVSKLNEEDQGKNTDQKHKEFDHELLSTILKERGEHLLQGKGIVVKEEFKWSINDVEFSHSISLWHIATFLLFYDDHRRYSSSALGIGEARIRDAQEEVIRFFGHVKSLSNNDARALLYNDNDFAGLPIHGKSVLQDGCKLASMLKALMEELQWDLEEK